MKNWQQQLRIFFINHPDFPHLRVHLERTPDRSFGCWRVTVRGKPPAHFKRGSNLHPLMLRDTPLEDALQTVIPAWRLWQSVCFHADGALVLINVDRPGTWWPELRLP